MQAKSLFILVTSTAVVLLCASAGPAEGPAEPADGGAPQLRSDAGFPDVYLNDSLEAEELIAKARRLADGGQWSAAAGLLEQACALYGDRLLRTEPGSYRSVVGFVRAQLCCWPEAGIAEYRKIADPAARRVLVEAGRGKDLASLLIGFERYFCSSSGCALGDTAAELALEAGEFAVARRVYQLLLAQHPDGATRASELAAKATVVDALAGDRRAVEEYLAREAGADESVVLPWLGAHRSVGEIIEEIRSSFTVERSPDCPPGWPTFAGSPQRNRIANFPHDRVARLWRFDRFGEGSPSMLSLADRSYGYHQTMDPRRLLGMNAVCADGLVLLQDAIRVWALHADSGRLAWVYGGLRDDATQTVSDNNVAPWYAPTVGNGRVCASLGTNLIPYYGHELPDDQSALVCLEARTGREIWRRDRSNSAVRFAQTDYDGAPLVIGDRVLVVERRRRAFGFEDCFLVCFDAETGKTRWRAHLGSASTGGFGYRRPTLAIIAADADTVYVSTNLGTVAAVSAYTGLVRWLRMYARDPVRDWQTPTTRNIPWRYNPVIVAGERVICLPTDVERVLVLDKDSGRIRREMATESIGEAVCLLGVVGANLYCVGGEASCYDLSAGKLRWTSALPADDHLFGRGLLTTDALLIPTERHLCAFALSDGARADHPWEQPGEGGNLLPAAERLIVVGADAVSAYANREKVWRELRWAMAADPDAPEPALDLAEIAFGSGETGEAIAVLEQAIKRAGGFAAIVDEGLKRRIFEDCLSFAEALREEGTPEAGVARRRIRLYEFASQCPPDKRAHIRHRLPLAELYEKIGQPERAVDLYQQIIADDSLRAEPYEGAASAASIPIGEFCQERIAGLIHAQGRKVYARFERRAAAMVEAGRAKRDLAVLNRVARAFPNATAARSAHIYQGEILRENKRFLAAARALYHAYVAYPTSTARPDRPDLLAQIAQMYKSAGRPHLARRWVDRAAREYPDARPMVHGGPMTWTQLRHLIGHADLPVEPTVARFTLPLTNRYEHTSAEPIALLAPATGPSPTTWKHYYVYTEAGVSAFAAATGEPLWEKPAPCRVQPVLLHAAGDRVVLATPHQVFACDTATGQRLWEHGAYPADLDDVNADHENFALIRYHAMHRDRLVSFRSDGRATCLNIRDGKTLWSEDLELIPTGPAAFGEDVITYPASRAGAITCGVLDAHTGKLQCTFSVAENTSIERTFISSDGRVIVLTGRALYAYDADTGERVWQARSAAPIVTSSVWVGLDGVYLSVDGQQIEKIRLSDGRPIWRSEALSIRREDTVRIVVHTGQVFVMGNDVTLALDAVDGRTVFAADVPHQAHLEAQFVTDHYLIVLEVQAGEGDRHEPMTLSAYDHRTGATAPADEGREVLGLFDDLRETVICDDALVIQDGRRILGWSARR